MLRTILQPLNPVKAVYSVVLWVVLFWISLVTAQAATVKLAWDPSSSSSVTGYRVYYGATSGSYTAATPTAPNLISKSVCVGTPVTCSYTTPDLPAGTCFAAKALDSAGNESGFSNEVCSSGAAAPVASFTASPTSGTTTTPITFTDTSTGTVSTRTWDLGDGTTSTAQSVAKTYNAAGSYTVTLTVGNSSGTTTATKTISVTNPTVAAPVASFIATPTSGPAPLQVTLTDTSTGTVSTRNWDLGDGTTSTAQSIAKTYNAAGSYTVTLTVGNSGGSSTTTKTITTTASAPVANFTASPNSGVAPLPVTFSNSSTNADSYSWNFGDNTTSTAQNPPSKTYANAGTYTVTMTATGASGTTPSTKTQTITVSAASASTGGLVAAYSFDEASGTTVFDASGQGNHGTISGATRRSGRFAQDQGLTFDGVDDWVTIPHAASLNLTSGMTLMAWVYPTATMSGWRTVVLKEDTNGGKYCLYANSNMNLPVGIVETSSNGKLATSGKSQLSAHNWKHVALAYDNQYQRLYVNGVQVAAQPQTGTISTSNGALRIGGSISNEFFKGHIDEVRVYNRVLSATEIWTDMNTAITASSPPKRFLGENALGSVSDSLPQGTAAAFQTTASVKGLVNSLYIYLDSGSASTYLFAGLYADNYGRPSARLAQGILRSPKMGSWNRVLLSSPTTVTAGTKYWIAILSTNGLLKFRDWVGSTAQPSETSLSTSLPYLPSTWKTGTVSANGPLSGYGAGW